MWLPRYVEHKMHLNRVSCYNKSEVGRHVENQNLNMKEEKKSCVILKKKPEFMLVAALYDSQAAFPNVENLLNQCDVLFLYRRAALVFWQIWANLYF